MTLRRVALTAGAILLAWLTWLAGGVLVGLTGLYDLDLPVRLLVLVAGLRLLEAIQARLPATLITEEHHG